MTIEWAFAQLKKWKKVRRKAWDEGEHLYRGMTDIKKEYKTGQIVDVTLYKDDLLAEDWEEFMPIMDDVERGYMEAVLRPFIRNKEVLSITKCYLPINKAEYIAIDLKGINGTQEVFTLPFFIKGTMYKGMKLDKRYTIRDIFRN